MGAVSRETCAGASKMRLWPTDLQQEIREAYGRLGRIAAPSGRRGEIVRDDRRCCGCEASPAFRTPTFGSCQADSVMRQDPQCWASLYSLESLSYRRRREIAESTVGHGGRRADHG